MKETKVKSNNGITLISLIVTIIVLIILAGISISILSEDSSVVKKATDAQILTELSNVREAVELYKIQKHRDGDMSDEELVEDGVLKEILIKDTYRTLGIIVNLEEIDIKSKLGKAGEKQEETEVETIQNLYDVYGIDMSDGTLYYIRDGIWSIEGTKVTYISDAGEEKEGYLVEIQIKYEGYIKMQEEQVEKFKKLETKILPEEIDYETLNGISLEGRQKLNKFKPRSIGQASRISGVSPADISVLLVYLQQKNGRNE